mgnify:CR=1 FL=1
MEMTLALNTICDKWLNILENSERLKEYCQSKYQKDPKFYFGGDPKNPPQENDCPYIVIIPGSKEEGLSLSPFSYTVYVFCVIAQQGIVKTDVETKLSGTVEISEISQIVYEELQTNLVDNPISSMNMDIITDTKFPQFASHMILITEIDPAMGEVMIY